MNILLIEDDHGVGRFVSRGLSVQGYAVTWLREAAEVETMVSTGVFDALVLDLGLPDGDGLALCRALRAAGCGTPILMLTARSGLHDRLDGFEVGADDYLGKPFAFEELLARLAVLVRRGAERRSATLRFDNLWLDATTGQARIGDRVIPLAPREHALLATLMRGAGRVVDRHALAMGIWGDTLVSDNALDVYVGYVRRRLKALTAPPTIETLRGRGYRLLAHEANRPEPRSHPA